MGFARWGIAGLVVALAACGSMVDPWPTHPEVVVPPAPSEITAPADIPAFQYAPMTPAALRAHVEHLASDQFEGRAPGTRGETLSVDYITRSFQLAGLQPGVPARNGARWTQNVPMVTATVTNSPALMVGDLADMRMYRYGEDFVGWTKRVEPHTALENAELVFVGYGVVARDLGWNDYAGLDMHGKIAVILVNDPDFETGDNRGFRGRAMTYYGRWTYKFEEAARQGAAGAIIVHETDAAGYPWGVVQSSWTGPQHDLERPDNGGSRVAVEGWMTERAARDLFARAGQDYNAQKQRAQRPDFSPLPLGLHASIVLDQTIEHHASRNVVGVLPGRARPQEAVLYSAHWDHLGHCPAVNGDDICNGAQDNATGVAGLIELARRFGSAGRLQRSMVFIAFTAEESGLLGSQYYAEHPLYAPAQTAAMINMDGLSTLGMARDITIVGMGQNDLDLMLSEAARTQDRRVVGEANPQRGGFFRSDHFSLAKIGVPVLMTSPGIDLYQGGVTRGRALTEAYTAQRYHKPDDEIQDSWDLACAMRDLQLLYAVGARLGEGVEWPNWRINNEFRSIRDASRRGMN